MADSSTVSNVKVKKAIAFITFLVLMFGPIAFAPGLKTLDANDPRISFELEEVASEVGIDFVHQAPQLDPRINHILPQIASVGASVSVVDFDNDGWQDLYFTNSATGSRNALYRNNQNGGFEIMPDSLGVSDVNMEGTGVSMGSVWADIDNDGFEDLFVYKWGEPRLFRNILGARFEDITNISGLPKWINANTAIWFDYDRDGLIDLFIGGYYDEEINLWNLKNTFFMPESFEYADNGGRNYLMKNLGGGRFRDVSKELGLKTTKWTLAAGAVDINGDGYDELIVANDYSVDEFYLNVGGRSFGEVGREVGIGFTPKSGMNVTFADPANEGDLGIYITNITEDGILIQGNNFWSLRPTEEGMAYKDIAGKLKVELGGWSYGAQFGDLNNDGFQDLYVANGFISADEKESYWYDYSKISGGNNRIISNSDNWPPMDGKSQSGYQQNKIWVNNQGRTFLDASLSVTKELRKDSRAVAMVDLWNRGVLDVVVANQKAAPFVFRNKSLNDNHWLSIELSGSASNMSAIGTKVEVSRGDYSLIQYIHGGIGFSSQNQRPLHFGLGEETSPVDIKITWPTGSIQEIENVEVDQFLQLTEKTF